MVAVGAAGGEKSGTNFHPRFPHRCNIAKVKPVPNLPLTLDELLEQEINSLIKKKLWWQSFGELSVHEHSLKLEKSGDVQLRLSASQ